MADFEHIPQISIVIPTINEAGSLPLLLADIKLWPYKIELTIVDAGSTDNTYLTTQLAGCNFIQVREPSRGGQLKAGASHASGEWLLFLHADCRLNSSWVTKVERVISDPLSKEYGWYFNFKTNREDIPFKILEKAVSLRNSLFQTPYGDQGLLIHKNLYKKVGGFSTIRIMEDIDFVLRLNKLTKMKRIQSDLITDSRRWKGESVIIRAFKNANLRKLWKDGLDDKSLIERYYS